MIKTNTESDLPTDEIIKQKSALMLQQLQHHTEKMGKLLDTKNDLKQVNSQELEKIKTQLKELKRGMSLGGLSIREAREEGQRY